MATTTSVNVDIRPVLSQLASVAEQLEKGQAAMPLCDRVHEIGMASEPRTCLVILGLTAEARMTVMSWLVGPQHHNIFLRLSSAADVLEIRLQDRGYSLETDGGERQEFESTEQFVEAFATAGWPASELAGPVKLALASDRQRPSLELIVPRDAGALLHSTNVLSSLTNRGAVLLVATPIPWSPTVEDEQAIQMLASCVPAVWPVYVGEANDSDRAPVSLRNLLPETALVLAPLTLQSGSNALPEWIGLHPASALRAALRDVAKLDQTESLLAMLQERLDTDLRQFQARQKRESRLERAADTTGREQDVKAVFDQFRAQVTNETNALVQSLRDGSRRALLKSSPLGNAVDESLASLKGDDLERETASKSIRLSLKVTVLEAFRRRLAKTLRKQLDEECVLIRDTFEELRSAAEPVLAAAGAITRGIALSAPDNRALWDPLTEMLEVDIRYRGEIPRRGFMQRLGEGRRMVFVMLMMLSLVGGFMTQFFGNLNPRRSVVIGLICLIVFIGAVLYTYRSWHQEEAESLDREITRVRDNVASEFNRMLTEILREKQTRILQFVEDQKKDLIMRLDVVMREAQIGSAATTEAERRDARAKLKIIEQRIRDLQTTSQQLGKVRMLLGEQKNNAGTALRTAANHLG